MFNDYGSQAYLRALCYIVSTRFIEIFLTYISSCIGHLCSVSYF